RRFVLDYQDTNAHDYSTCNHTGWYNSGLWLLYQPVPRGGRRHAVTPRAALEHGHEFGGLRRGVRTGPAPALGADGGGLATAPNSFYPFCHPFSYHPFFLPFSLP